MEGSISSRKRFNYWFDNTMSRGTIALIGWLFAISAMLILTIAFLVWVTRIDQGERGFFDLVWAGLLRTLDPGTMGGDQGGVFFLFSMLAVTLGDVFVVSLLIGVLTSGIESKLEELPINLEDIRNSNHHPEIPERTLILGWNRNGPRIVQELNHYVPQGSAVTIVTHCPVEEIKEMLIPLGLQRQQVEIHQGNPTNRRTLDCLQIPGYNHVIMLDDSDHLNPQQADAHTLVTLQLSKRPASEARLW